MSARLAVPLLLAAVAAAYAGSLGNGFTYDDFQVIVGNPFILSWANLRDVLSLRYLETSGELSYRPMVSLSYMADVSFWGLQAFGFHLTNLLLHALNVSLWWLVARAWLPPLAALGSAALVAIHPAVSEAVLSVGYREELLFSAFSLAVLVLALSPALRAAAPSATRCVLAWGLYALALLSKEMALPLPFIVALLVLLPRPAHSESRAVSMDASMDVMGDRLRRNARLLAGLFAGAAIYLVVRLQVLRGVEESMFPPLSPSWWKGPLTMLTVVAHDVRMFIMPTSLSADHDLQVLPTLLSGRLAWSLALLGGLGWLAWRARKARPLVSAGVVWFGVTLLPVLNIIPIANPSAERYLYFPFLGLSLAAGAAAVEAYGVGLGAAPKQIMTAGLALIFISFVLLTNQRGRVWHDNVSLWRATLSVPSSKERPYHNLADAWSERVSRRQAEEADWRKRGHNDKARLSRAAMRYAASAAASLYATALRRNPNAWESYNNLGTLYRTERRYARSLYSLQTALRLKRGYADAWNNLGITYKRLGYRDKAIATYLRTLSVTPGYAPAYKNLGIAQLELGRRVRARKSFERTLQLNPRIDQHEAIRTLVGQLGR